MYGNKKITISCIGKGSGSGKALLNLISYQICHPQMCKMKGHGTTVTTIISRKVVSLLVFEFVDNVVLISWPRRCSHNRWNYDWMIPESNVIVDNEDTNPRSMPWSIRKKKRCSNCKTVVCNRWNFSKPLDEVECKRNKASYLTPQVHANKTKTLP